MTNPILKAHLEGMEMFKKEFADGLCVSCGEWYRSEKKEVPKTCVHTQPDKLLTFLTTYGTNLLKAALEAGPGEREHKYKGKLIDNSDAAFAEIENKGHNSCRSSFHSVIDESIKEIK